MLEFILKSMKKSNNFFETIEIPELDKIWNGIQVKELGGTLVIISGSEYDRTPELQDGFINTNGALVQKNE